MIALDRPKMYRKKKRPAKVPEYLVYEIMDGVPYYYKGYRDVLNNTKTLEEIMGSSSYQWKIIEYLLRILFTGLNACKYSIATNEPGLHLDRRNNLAGDILVFDKNDLPGNAISVKYTNVPAVLHIEVDIAADLEDEIAIIYLEKKVNKLIAFGTKRVLWIFSKDKRILEAIAEATWKWHDWNETLPLLEGINFNIADFLKAEGIEIRE